MMRHSDTIGALAAALAKVHTELEPVQKNSTNPFLNSRYADLGVIIEAAKKVLPKNGLSYAQLPCGSAGEVGVSTIVMHESGEWLSDEITIQQVDEKGKSAAQVAGSIITYLRRYALAAALGLYADEDNDGSAPQARNGQAQQSGQRQQRSAGQPGGKATDSQLRMLGKVLDQVGLGGWGADFPDAGKEVAAFLGRTLTGPEDLSTAEASKAIDHFKELANGAPK